MLTPEQKERRKKSLGASDMAAVIGISRYATPYDVWLDKTGKLEDKPENKAMEAGNRFERSVVAWAKQQLGPLRRNVFVVAGDGLPIHANLDAKLIESGDPVEAKTAGLFGPLSSEWGAPGTDEIPEGYIVQAQVQLICTKRDICHVPAFLSGRGFEMFKVEKNDRLQEVIITKAVEFWDRYVKTDTPPEGFSPSIDVVKFVKRLPGKTISVGADIAKAYLMAQETKKAALDAEEKAKADLLAAMGDAEATEPIEGIGSFTYFEMEKKAYTVQAAKYRVLRHKKEKGVIRI